MKTDDLDRMLDEALASYSSGEPRTGLSGRVMARVRSEGTRSRSWWWVLAAAAAVLACVAFVMEAPRSERMKPVVVKKVAPAQKPVEPSPAIAKIETPSPVPTHRRRSRPRLTQEERMLLALAQQPPEATNWLAQPDKPLEVVPLEIRPLQVDGLDSGETTGEMK
jgi:hypothetical protein